MTTAPTALSIAPGIHVAVANQADLTPHEQDEPTGLPPWRAAEYAAARALLRHVLAEAVDEHATRTPIGNRRTGQPYLPDRPDLCVSLAHDEGLVAAAVGIGTPVGVDVQRPTAVTDALLRRCCTPTARAVLGTLPAEQREREFARIWTVQEACVKAAGTGMAGEPWRIPVEVGQQEGVWSGLRWRSVPVHLDAPAAVAYAADEHHHSGR